MYIGIFDLFKIGIGPSSSHTVGPMRAARRFLIELGDADFARVARVEVELFGSLAHTGRGHGTDFAILLGLMGEVPDSVDTAGIADVVANIRDRRELNLLGRKVVAFDEAKDLPFNFKDVLPVHSNGMAFRAFAADGSLIGEREMYSVGGGFVVDAEEAFVGTPRGEEAAVPYPFETMEALLALGRETGKPLTDMLAANEYSLHGEAHTREFVARVEAVMHECIRLGLETDGILPGGLAVKRRAKALGERLSGGAGMAGQDTMNWVSTFAIAVNEQNAAGARVVTAPTNGAAGIVPAVLEYYRRFCNGDDAGVMRYFLAAAAVGSLCKRNASISGAEVGCQGEVGSAAAMAAAGLAAALNASNEQIENAAEIALEHHFGMTCDPIGGLVQVPCIERNAMGAVKAINACSLSMLGDGTHLVSLDQAIETMRRTGADMQSKYKETALGGLAITVSMPASIAQVEC
ncbi:MAG: L-serine ammonia-lyase [Betaproteobacteria bacterium]|nr:L-serine ammonia-lyase [Betaproteobacteria bacterium]